MILSLNPATSGFVLLIPVTAIMLAMLIFEASSAVVISAITTAFCQSVRSENRPADSPKRFGERFLKF